MPENKNRIKQIRIEKHYTLQQVADALNIGNNTISRYENGEREPKIETWKKLADYLNVSVAYLMGLTDESDYKYENPDEKSTQSFESFIDTQEYKSLFSAIRKSVLLYLARYYPMFKTETIENIANDLANENIKIFWNRYLKKPSATSEGINKTTDAINQAKKKRDEDVE